MRNKVLVLLFALTLRLGQSGVFWSTPVAIRSGVVEVIGVGNPVGLHPPLINTNVSFTSSLPISSSMYSGASLSSFDLAITEQFSFNISITALTINSISFSFDVIGNTYINIARINFVAGANVFANYSFFTTMGCYLTNDLWSFNIYDEVPARNQTLGPVTLPFGNSFSPSSNYIVSSTLSGMQFQNALGLYNILSIENVVPSSGNTMNYTVSIGANCSLKWICITTVFVNQAVNLANYDLVVQYKSLTLTQASNMSNVAYSNRFDGQNRLFFGVSAINFLMNGDRYLNVQNYNVAYVAPYYATNSMLVSAKYQMIFYVKRSCSSSTYYDPELYECYSVCDPSSNLLISATACLPCAYMCYSCQAANSFNCTQCDTIRKRNSTLITQGSLKTCVCANGYVDKGIADCVSCELYLPGCTRCVNTTFCQSCDTTVYVLDLTTNTCGCAPNKYLTTGYCLTYPGCLSAFYLTTGVVCSSCDLANNFILTATYNCTCNMGYILYPNDTCVHTCGNGMTPATPGMCDDGNLVNGDGCSSVCTIEPNWHCTYDNITGGISHCVPIKKIQVSYMYSLRTVGDNEGTIFFSITPSINDTASIFLSQIRDYLPAASANVFAYDVVDSILRITVRYSQNIEQTNQQMVLSFENLSFYSYPITVSYAPVGLNAMLTYDEYASQSSAIHYISLVLGAVSVVLAIFSGVVGLKLIGIELILPIQLIYFSLSLVPYSYSSISSLAYLKYSNGYMTLQSYDYTNNYRNAINIVKIHYQTEFLLECNIMEIIFIFILLILLIQFIVLRCKEYKLQRFLQLNDANVENSEDQQLIKKHAKQQENNNNMTEQLVVNKKEEAKLRISVYQSLRFLSFLIDNIYFIFLAIVINELIFSSIIGLQNTSSFVYSLTYNIIFSSVCITLLWGNIPFILHDYEFTKTITFHSTREIYPLIYLTVDIILIFFLGFTYSFSFCPYIMLGLSTLFVILILICKPYHDSICNSDTFCSLYFQLVLVLSLAIICYLANGNVSEFISMVMAYIICGLIFIADVLATYKIIQKVNFKKAFDDVRNYEEDEDNLLENKEKKVIQRKLDLIFTNLSDQVPPQSVRQGILTSKSKMLDWNKDEDQAFDKKEQEPLQVKMDEKLNELELIKRRLRNNLRLKKQQQQGSQTKPKKDFNKLQDEQFIKVEDNQKI